MAVMESMTESVFISMTCNLFLIKLQVSSINDSDSFYDGAWLYLIVVVVCF